MRQARPRHLAFEGQEEIATVYLAAAPAAVRWSVGRVLTLFPTAARISTPGIMRLAYLILSHQLPHQVARLVGALRDRDNSFFIHVDKRAEPQVHRTLLARLGDDASVQFVPAHACYWGSFGIVEATIEGIRTLIESGTLFERLILLSGQDYPIKPQRYIKAFLERQDNQQFIESFPLTEPNKWTEHTGPYKDLNRILHWHVNFRSRFLHIPIRRSLPRRMQPYGGSQWWCLSQACVEYVHEFIQRNPKVVDYFKRAFIADELFFQTMVSNSPFADRVTGSSLTYEDWDTPAPPYPALLDRAYLRTLAASHKLFARKFDETRNTGILDAVDELLRPQAAALPAAARGQVAGSATAG
jgi:hypothetical protein